MRNFESFMKRMLGREHTIDRRLLAFDGVVAVQFSHCPSRRHRIGSIDLDLVIVLGVTANGNECYHRRREPTEPQTGELIGAFPSAATRERARVKVRTVSRLKTVAAKTLRAPVVAQRNSTLKTEERQLERDYLPALTS